MKDNGIQPSDKLTATQKEIAPDNNGECPEQEFMENESTLQFFWKKIGTFYNIAVKILVATVIILFIVPIASQNYGL